jgi:FkbM family methyltransferase
LRKIKVALASRYLFDNWFWLLVRYALAGLGFNVRLRARVGDCITELDPEVFARLVSRFSRGNKLIKSIRCVGGKLFVNDVEVDNINDVIYNSETWARLLGWTYDKVLNCWVKDGVRFRRMYLPITEVFDYGAYVALDVGGRVVVDVGAFVGDSAIYFALRGAKRVIAIEPHPGAYAEMLENIKLNSLERVIVPINCGIASRPGRLCVEDVDIEGTVRTYHKPSDRDIAIPVITLGEVINKFDIGDDAVLKMDCEGCEYDVIMDDYQDVRVFRELIFEYHSYAVGKPISRLLKVLAKDYKCSLIEEDENLGRVYCVKYC